jgi:hypothetical protein
VPHRRATRTRDDTRGRKWTEFTGKRLAEFVFKMADLLDLTNANENLNEVLDEDVRSMLSGLDRPVHQAFINGKLLCPKDICIEKMEFFEGNGIDHHFRVKHNAPFTNSDHDDSLRVFRTLHEKETKECLEMIFRCRERKVCIFFDYSNYSFDYFYGGIYLF